MVQRKAVATAAATLRCPDCDATQHDVKETRHIGGTIVRRRECFNHHRFYTEERVVTDNPTTQASSKKSTLRTLAAEIETMQRVIEGLRKDLNQVKELSK